MPHSIPPDPYFRYPTNPNELAILFTDHAEQARRLNFNRRWGLPDNATITDGMVRSSSILIQEGHHLVQTYPRERLLFLTLTFKSRQQAQNVSKAFNDINRRFLGTFIEAWIKVVDVHENGQDHIHALGVTKDDILAGTDLSRVRAFLDTVKAADNCNGELPWSERRALRNATSHNLTLAFLWETLDFSLMKFGFGWVFDAMPVIKPRSVPGYLRRAYLRGRWHDARHGIKNSRRVSYSENLRRKFPGGIIPITESGIRRERAFLEAFGLRHRGDFREHLGRSWGFLIHQQLPKMLHLKAPAELFLPEDLAMKLLNLCKTNPHFRFRLSPLVMNLIRVASARSNPCTK